MESAIQPVVVPPETHFAFTKGVVGHDDVADVRHRQHSIKMFEEIRRIEERPGFFEIGSPGIKPKRRQDRNDAAGRFGQWCVFDKDRLPNQIGTFCFG